MEPKLHPVIKHLLERRNKTVPVADGRKIALVLFGGLMTGARGAGAVTALEELGLAGAFDDIYTISAGFPNACYLLTQNTHEGVKIYYEDLCSKEFINFERVWDIVNIPYGLDVIKNKKPLDYEKLSQAKTNLWVRLLNLKTKKPEYKNVHGRPTKGLEEVMHAAVSLPYLNPGSVELDDSEFKDAGTITSDVIPSIKEVLDSDATDILIIYNRVYQFETLRHAGIIDSERLYQIIPYAESEFPRVCTDSSIIKKGAQEMGALVKSTFGEDGGIEI